MRLKLDLDEDTTTKLIERAGAERRPVPWQAEVLLREALGLPFPYPEMSNPTSPPSEEVASELS